MRLLVSPELSAWIVARIAAYSAESPEQLGWLTAYVVEAGAFPLYVGWFETIALRPDGEIVRWSTENDYAGTRPVEEKSVWLSSLVDAAKRYPQLRALLPERPGGAKDCPYLTYPAHKEGKLFCPECCGLGWVEG